MKDPRVPKDRQRLIHELNAEFWNLRLACEQWELGHYQQTTTIAKTLRVLLYDYNKDKKSLFAQLKLKQKPFITTGRLQHFPKRRSWQALTHSRFAVAFNKDRTAPTSVKRLWEPNYFYPKRRDSGLSSNESTKLKSEPFVAWWNDTVVSNESFSLSRADIVDAVSNELGGAHSSDRVKPSTAALLTGELDYPDHLRSFSVFGHTVDDTNSSIDNTLVDAIVRQIAYEVQCTADRYHRDLVNPHAVVCPCPPDWKRIDSAVKIVHNRTDAREILEQLRASGQGETVIAKELESQIFWNEYKDDLVRRGL